MKEKILVVDDERMIRWTLTEALSSWGYAPIEADTVKASLATFDAEQPSVTLLDINLPDGSGLDVLSEIKRRKPDAVVVMITANVLVDDTIAALRGGAYDFIGKPINLEELQILLQRIESSGWFRFARCGCRFRLLERPGNLDTLADVLCGILLAAAAKLERLTRAGRPGRGRAVDR